MSKTRFIPRDLTEISHTKVLCHHCEGFMCNGGRARAELKSQMGHHLLVEGSVGRTNNNEKISENHYTENIGNYGGNV